MKKTEKQKRRIIENIFDLMCETSFNKDAIKQMRKDLKGKNVTFDGTRNIILIENEDATVTQYTISIV